MPPASPTARGRAVVVAAVAALSACAGGRPDAARPAPPPAAAFEQVPAAEVAAAKNPHDRAGKPLCQRCHRPDLKLTSEPNALCRECHRFGHGNHPVDVTQPTAAEGLPLLAGGKLACHTCHDPHRAPRVGLRKPFNELCKTCHGSH